jgi:hypothetical protein
MLNGEGALQGSGQPVHFLGYDIPNNCLWGVSAIVLPLSQPVQHSTSLRMRSVLLGGPRVADVASNQPLIFLSCLLQTSLRCPEQWALSINWEQMPVQCQPGNSYKEGQSQALRVQRKRLQVASFALVLRQLLPQVAVRCCLGHNIQSAGMLQAKC